MKKKQLNPNWIDSVLEKCEDIGIPKHIIFRFSDYYLKEGKQSNA